MTVFRSSTGTWYWNRSSAGINIVGFGTAGDLPVPYSVVRYSKLQLGSGLNSAASIANSPALEAADTNQS